MEGLRNLPAYHYENDRIELARSTHHNQYQILNTPVAPTIVKVYPSHLCGLVIFYFDSKSLQLFELEALAVICHSLSLKLMIHHF